MSGPAVRGWCPGAYRPMMSGDGLVVRVRPRYSRISTLQAEGLAELAEAHGNGMIELTSRANLQIRGVTESAFPTLLSGLGGLGLIDSSAEDEARRNIVLTPFADAAARANEDMADALAAGLAAAGIPVLPAKFGFLIDAGSQVRHLGGVSGDIRIEAACCGGTVVRADGATRGKRVADVDEAVHVALGLARWFATSGGIGEDGRGRMRGFITGGAQLPDHLAGDVAPAEALEAPGPGPNGDGFCVGAAFGLMPADLLRRIAVEVPGPIRVTPFRMLCLAGAELPASLMRHPDLITKPGDPLLRVSGCTGAPACPQAQAATRALARDLAPLLPDGAMLHVSGCSKGCAHPGPADFTLAGYKGTFDLVKNGCAWDEPERRGMSPREIVAMFGEL